MPELSEESLSERPDINRLLGIVRRRHLQFLVPLFLGWAVVWGASWILPASYKSGTLILVEQPTMPQNYVLPNINDDMQSRLESIKQQILSRTRLLLIIDKLHLYSRMGRQATADEKIDRMRKDIDVEIERDPQKQNISAFRIYYTAANPHLAQQVTGELANLFINENLKVRQAQSETTTSFIEKQLQDARASLSDQEAKVRQFEGRHEGDLPTQQASNLQILAGLQAQLQGEEDALNTAKQQRVYLQAMLEEERSAQAKVRPAGAEGVDAATAAQLAAIDKDLETMRAQLAQLSSRYTDRYPDVQSLKTQIAKTEAIRAKLIASEKPRTGEGAAGTAADPTLSATARQLQSQLQANQLEISNREAAISGLKAKIGGYQGRLNAEPATEQELADLTRGYDQSKANYDDLLKKRDQSEMATSMEQAQQGERFTVLDPPTLPTKPDFPNRFLFCAFGLALGLVLGFAVAAGFEFFDDRMHSEKEIKALLPVAVISEIPEIVSPMDEEKTKRRLAWRWATTALMFVTILAGFVFSYLHD